MQITADISKILKNVRSDLTFIYDILSELRIGFISFLVILALENVVSFTKTCFYRKRTNFKLQKQLTLNYNKKLILNYKSNLF